MLKYFSCQTKYIKMCKKKLSRNYLIILLKVCEWQNAGTDRTDFLNRLEWSRVCLWKRWTSNWWGWGGSWSCQGGVFCWRGSCGFKKGAKETERVTEKKKISERQTIAVRPTGTWWRFSQRSGQSSSSFRSSPLVYRPSTSSTSTSPAAWSTSPRKAPCSNVAEDKRTSVL